MLKIKQKKVHALTLTLMFGLILGLTGCETKPGIEILEAWGRPSPASSDLGAIYMKIRNNSNQEEKLLSASSAACGTIEMHETMMEGDMMSMSPVAEGYIAIPAGETVELKTGGLHLMCIGKQAEFNEGATISLTLEFDQFGEVTLDVEVQNP